MAVTNASYMIDLNITDLYMTDTLHFSKEKLNFVKVIQVPANLFCAVLSSYLVSERPLLSLVNVSLFRIVVHSYAVLGMLSLLPDKDHSNFDVMHIAAVQLVTDLAENISFVIEFSIVSKIVDKRIAGIYITTFASLMNLTKFGHKFYIYKAVDQFDIFLPQAVLTIGSLIFAIMLSSRVV